MNREMRVVRRGLTWMMSLGLLVGIASCDTDVVNPGPIDADFLNDPASQQAITNGTGRALADALNWIAYTGAAVARARSSPRRSTSRLPSVSAISTATAVSCSSAESRKSRKRMERSSASTAA